jgi:hypothetical protein
VETNATRMCALLVGLPEIAVLGVDDRSGQPLRVHVEPVVEVEGCSGCGVGAWVKDRRPVALVDLPTFGRPAVLVWHKRRWRCPDVNDGDVDRDRPAHRCDAGEGHRPGRPVVCARSAATAGRSARWHASSAVTGTP